MQNRDKQIEEIVKDFCPLYQEYGSCKQCNKGLTIDDEPCYYGCVANLIIDYGYRKASDVAEEIFAEIEKVMSSLDRIYMESGNPKQSWGVRGAMTKIAELKKKYIGKDTNVTTKESDKDNDTH